MAHSGKISMVKPREGAGSSDQRSCELVLGGTTAFFIPLAHPNYNALVSLAFLALANQLPVVIDSKPEQIPNGITANIVVTMSVGVVG
jgi:hypothetical protein